MSNIFKSKGELRVMGHASVTVTLLDGTVSIAAGGNVNSTVIDCEGTSAGLLYVNSANQLDIVIDLSDDNVTYYRLDEKIDVTAGTKAYRVDLKGAKFLRVNVTNDGITAMTPTIKLSLTGG